MTNGGGPSAQILATVAREFDTPCYVYNVDLVRQRTEQLRRVFGNRFLISYAVKCNPSIALLDRLRGIVDMLDVSSGGEIELAADAGWSGNDLGFTGPGKMANELVTALEHGVREIIVESVDEADLLNRLAAEAGAVQRVLVRIGAARVPRGFGLNMSGKPSQFGVDEEDIDGALAAIRGMRNLRLSGFHVYSGTQCLDADSIAENYEILVELFRRVCSTHDIKPHRLVFGSGIGIPYFDGEKPVDLEAVASRINPALDELKGEARFSGTELVLETGRFLVGEAGVYLTRVIRVKRSRGVDICICDGGMNHHLAAAGHLGVVPRNYRMVKIEGGSADTAESEYTLVGPLCTTIDTIGRRVKFPGLAAGDALGILSSGAYGLSVSPIHFISHPLPREILVETIDGEVRMDDACELADRQATGPPHRRALP